MTRSLPLTEMNLSRPPYNPRSCECHALQTARVLDERGRATRSGIIFRSKRGACSPTGITFAKLARWWADAAPSCARSERIFPHHDFSHWTLCDVRRPTLQEGFMQSSSATRDSRAHKPKAQAVGYGAEFSTWSSDDVSSKEPENQARTQRLRELQRYGSSHHVHEVFRWEELVVSTCP